MSTGDTIALVAYASGFLVWCAFLLFFWCKEAPAWRSALAMFALGLAWPAVAVVALGIWFCHRLDNP